MRRSSVQTFLYHKMFPYITICSLSYGPTHFFPPRTINMYTNYNTCKYTCCVTLLHEQKLEGLMVPLDVVPARLAGRVGRWVARRFPWVFGGAAAAEEAPSYNGETCSAPSNKQSTSKFIPVNDTHITLIILWTIFFFITNVLTILQLITSYSINPNSQQ